MLLILFAIFVLPLTSTLLSFTLYCYEETNRTGVPLSAYIKLAIRTALRGVISEVFMLWLHPVGLIPGLWSTPGTGKGLVILVHGLFHNPMAWALFRHRLQARGYATACIAYSSWNTDWDTVVRHVHHELNRLANKYPHDVHLVGHSLGGLLLRAALGQMDTPLSIRTLITLGTPFDGSKMSPFALHSLGRYLSYQGATVRTVAALPFPKQVRALALRSPTDNMVLPSTALHCRVPGWTEHETHAVSHVGMLHDENVFAQILSWIRCHSV